MSKKSGSILWLSKATQDDSHVIGEKAARLAELWKEEIPLPDGFIVTSHAYQTFITQNNLVRKVTHLLSSVDFARPESLLQASSFIKKYIMEDPLADTFVHEVFSAYKSLGSLLKDPQVTMQTSIGSDELMNIAFTGYDDIFYDVFGEANVIIKIKEIWASYFDAGRIAFRHERNINHFNANISVIIQKSVDADQSGYLYTVNPVGHDTTKIIIKAIAGPQEFPLQNNQQFDIYEVTKKDLFINKKTIFNQRTKYKKTANSTKLIKLIDDESKEQKISDHYILSLATLGKKLEQKYLLPQACEWVVKQGQISITRIRQVSSEISPEVVTDTENNASLLASGSPVVPGIAIGKVVYMKRKDPIIHVQKGDILVTNELTAEQYPLLKNVSAVITEATSRTSHGVLKARELGIPTVIGVHNAYEKIKNGQIITVNGTTGNIYKGNYYHPTKPTTQNAWPLLKTATKVYAELQDIKQLEKISLENIDGIGLLHAETLIKRIGAHPKKHIHEKEEKIFIKKLSDQIVTVTKTLSPKPVLYCLSDFTTKDYQNLTGGKLYEHHELNPELGYRGVFRFLYDSELFTLELAAIKEVRNKLRQKNLWIMLPFVRTVHELHEIKKMLSLEGLHRSPTFKVWMQIDTPSNVIQIEKFLEEGIDGIAIDADDLTMLTLGIDKTNEELASAFDEQHAAMLWAYEKVIKAANNYNIPSTISGHVVSHYSSFIEKVVNWGISSVTVLPDTVESIKEKISEIEKKIIF